MNGSMPNGQLLLAFAATAIVINVVPGPSALFIVGRALSVGRPAAIAAAAGNTLGVLVQGLLAVIGLGSLVAQSDAVFHAVRLSAPCISSRWGQRPSAIAEPRQ